MTYKILCVDDDPNILEGYKRALRKDFEIHTAEGGIEAIAMIERDGPFAVVVSDMRMPVMDGVGLLRLVREKSPDTVRMMLTGNADQKTAVDAVNEGSIFRFMTKPCPPEDLARALTAGIAQYRLITAEKSLLEETLKQSLQVLVEVLAMVNPTAFNRSNRVKTLAREVADSLGVDHSWEVEFAALLSQIGCIAVPEEILQKIARGEALSEREAALYHRHPKTGHDLIERIPRMENVAEMIAHQNIRINDEIVSRKGAYNTPLIERGARILKAVFDYDKLLQAGHLPLSAYHELSDRLGWYDPVVLKALHSLIEKYEEEYVVHDLFIVDLKPGMILDEALFSTRDTLLLSAGQEITMSLILRLINFAEAGSIRPTARVKVPVSALEDVEVAA